MPIATDVLSPVDRADITAAVVEVVTTDGADHQRAAAAAVIKHWESSEWPAGLVAQSLFLSTDGRSLLTYCQWSAGEPQMDSAVRPDWRGLGAESATPKAYTLYRRVRPAEVPDPVPLPQCFPAAFFPMDGRDAACRWIDGLLDKEERDEGADRAYPGALAANFHAGADGVFLLSEWASEAEAVAHIEEVIEPLLEYMGQAEAGAGSRYTFHATVDISLPER